MFNIDVKDTRIYKNTTSFSHVLGNLTSVIEDYIETSLPTNYFKQKRATTEVAFKDIRDFKKNLIQAEKPYLIIEPRIFMDEESEYLPQVNWDRFIPIDQKSNPMFYMMNHEFFIVDDKRNFSLGYTFNRYKLQFNISILVDTEMMGISLMNYLKSNLRFRHPYPIERYTETLIPKSYIEYIAEKYGMDVKSNDFIKKLNEHSPYTILRLHRPANDKMEFFILSSSRLNLRMPNYPTESKVMVGRVERYSQVQFTIDMETNIMNNFLLLTTDKVKDEELMTDYMVRVCIDSRSPHLESIVDGRSLYTKLAVEFDKGGEEIDLNEFMGDDTKPLLQYIRDNSLNDDYVEVYVYEWRHRLDLENSDIMSVDLNNLLLKTNKVKPETVYTIAIYFDMNYLAKIKKYVNPVNTVGSDYNRHDGENI